MSDSEDEQSANGPSRNLDNKDLPALFWDSMPDNAEEHPDYVAMQALAEESTPEERAENFKASRPTTIPTGPSAALAARKTVACMPTLTCRQSIYSPLAPAASSVITVADRLTVSNRRQPMG